VLVAFDTPVADPPVALCHEPGDRAFDHGPAVPVVVGEVTVGPGSAGDDEFDVACSEGQCSTLGSGGAARPQWAALAAGSEGGSARGSDGDGVPAWTGRGAGGVIDDEVVAGELVGTQLGVPS